MLWLHEECDSLLFVHLYYNCDAVFCLCLKLVGLYTVMTLGTKGTTLSLNHLYLYKNVDFNKDTYLVATNSIKDLLVSGKYR